LQLLPGLCVLSIVIELNRGPVAMAFNHHYFWSSPVAADS